jgi:drug/metabolite transporter (DMT)-like permease
LTPSTGDATRETAPVASYLLLAASMALVGSYVALSKLLVAAFPVFLLAWLRFGIAALAMLHWLRREPGEPALSASDRRLLFWESFVGNFLFSICMLQGVALTSALAAGVSMAAIPAAVALLSWLWLRERIGVRLMGAIVLAMAGMTLLATTRHAGAGSGGGGAMLGYALLLAAAFCEATYVVVGKRLTGNVSPRRISALINLWGLALMTPLGLWQALDFDFGAVTSAMWSLLVFYALAASMVSVWLWMQGLRHVPAARASVFVVCLPVTAAAIGTLVLGEVFGLPHAVALAMAIAGLLLATWPARA